MKKMNETMKNAVCRLVYTFFSRLAPMELKRGKDAVPLFKSEMSGVYDTSQEIIAAGHVSDPASVYPL